VVVDVGGAVDVDGTITEGDGDEDESDGVEIVVLVDES
jgi:hypothetical protein